MSVSLDEGRLFLTVMGQQRFELERMQGAVYGIKGLSGYTIEFKQDDTGAVTGLGIVQPGGRMFAGRS